MQKRAERNDSDSAGCCNPHNKNKGMPRLEKYSGTGAPTPRAYPPRIRNCKFNFLFLFYIPPMTFFIARRTRPTPSN